MGPAPERGRRGSTRYQEPVPVDALPQSARPPDGPSSTLPNTAAAAPEAGNPGVAPQDQCFRRTLSSFLASDLETNLGVESDDSSALRQLVDLLPEWERA